MMERGIVCLPCLWLKVQGAYVNGVYLSLCTFIPYIYSILNSLSITFYYLSEFSMRIKKRLLHEIIIPLKDDIVREQSLRETLKELIKLLCLSHKGKKGLVETSKFSIKINQTQSKTELLLVSPLFF